MNDLNEIFQVLRTSLQHYQPPLVPKTDSERYYDLWSIKPVVIDGRQRREVFFAGIIIQKSYVGFYYMPVYAEPELKTVFQPELLKLLKGKSCFHIRRLDDALLAQVNDALRIGFELYRKNGWVDEPPQEVPE